MSQIKLMIKWVKLALFISAILLVNCVTWFVTTANQKARLYPIDADSIGIPIMLTITVSILILPPVFFISMLPNNNVLVRLKSEGLFSRLVLLTCFLLLYAFVFWFAVHGITYWNFLGHYFIVVSYLILFFISLIYLYIDCREIYRGLKD